LHAFHNDGDDTTSHEMYTTYLCYVEDVGTRF